MPSIVISGATVSRLSHLLVNRSKGVHDTLNSHAYRTLGYFSNFTCRDTVDDELRVHSDVLGQAVAHAAYEQYVTFLAGLVHDLAFIVDAIVLADEITFLSGVTCDQFPMFADGQWDSYDSLSAALAEPHPGYRQIYHHADECNWLIDQLTDNIPRAKPHNASQSAYECAAVANTIFVLSQNLKFSISPSGELDLDRLRMQREEEDDSAYGFDGEHLEEVTKWLRDHRGEGFPDFCGATSDEISKIPEFLFKSVGFHHTRREGNQFSQLVYTIGLFEEIVASIQTRSTILPSWANRDYLESIGESPYLRGVDIVHLAHSEIDLSLARALETTGIATLDLRIPALLRTCCAGASDIEAVIARALEIRQSAWATDYRRYLSEIQQETDPVRIRKTALKLADLADRSRSGLAESIGGITVTGEGGFSVTASIVRAIKGVMRQRHPVMIYNSRLDSLLRDSAPLQDLARVMRLKPGDLASAVRARP